MRLYWSSLALRVTTGENRTEKAVLKLTFFCLPVNPVRTLSATKAAFFSAYPRPINAVYRRVVEELLVELHLTTVNSTFIYDPFFALGMVTLYDGLMEAYQPPEQREAIFNALCKALHLKPEVLRKNARDLLELMRSGDPRQRLDLLCLKPEAEDVGGLKAILERMTQPPYAYSRVLAVGLYTAYEAVAKSLYKEAEERTRRFLEDVVGKLPFSAERVKKDLELYRSSLDRMKQARAVVEEMVKAARRQQERRQSAASLPETSLADPSEPSS
ncbi:photosystem II biogenesis protein Psp29 [Synechococcus sp. R50.1]|jgi:photosystem II biogenesis protein Psp29|uniref:photosystem II biogenesis protein Psp29 n=1 Tax=unclassified Synechococcus TaxID=2626047 RepID=UPI0039C390FA